MILQEVKRNLTNLSFKVRYLWIGLALFLLFMCALALVQFASPGLVGNDGYYHIKLAELIRTQGLKPMFDYLPLTVLNSEEFVDHHYLFHLLMVPFTFGDLRIGAKLASAFFPALAFVAVWWMLKERGVPYAALWSLGLLAISEAFLYRMSMPRAQSLSLLLLILCLHTMLKGRHWPLALLGFLFVWSYNAFPLLLILVLAYTAALWLDNQKIKVQPLLFSSIGIALGLIINPYFPDNLVFICRHIAPKLLDATSISVGNEWFPYTTAALLENSGLALLVFLSGVFALGLSKMKMSIEITTSFFMVVIFGFMLFQSRRFVEYAPAFMLIFAAFAWQPVIEQWKESAADNQSIGCRRLKPRFQTKRIGIFFLIALMLGTMLWSNLSVTRKNFQANNRPYQRFQEAAVWLQKNSPAKSLVFQTDWDDFPQLFFNNTHNTYTIGLDPTYMQSFDEELYDRWVEITEGDVESPGFEIQKEFGAQFVITDLNHKRFIEQANQDPNLVLVYEDRYAMIYQIQ